MSPDEIRWRFDFHPATDEEKRNAHGSVRATLRDAALTIRQLVPDGRELATAVTKLEEAMYWANAGLARSRI